MEEVKERGSRAIQADVLAKEHHLNERQCAALRFLMEHAAMSIQDYVGLCPDASRRSLQRDLKELLDKGLIEARGATNRLEYRKL